MTSQPDLSRTRFRQNTQSYCLPFTQPNLNRLELSRFHNKSLNLGFPHLDLHFERDFHQ